MRSSPAGQSTLFPADSRNYANHLVLPGSEKARKMTVGSGTKCLESLKKSDQHGSSLKMFTDLLVKTGEWHSTKCYLTWKLKALKFSRLLFQLVPKTLRTGEIESGLLPTMTEHGNYNRKGVSLTSGDGLATVVGMVATPTTPRPHDSENTAGKYYPSQNQEDLTKAVGMNPGLKLQPNFVEWMMGFPQNYTLVEDSESVD